MALQDAAGNRPSIAGALAVSESAIPIPRQAIAVMWGQQDRAQGYALQPDGSFYVDGAFDATLPPDTHHLTVSKGFVYVAQTLQLDVTAADGLTREIRLDRWIDMPARGWYSSDDHIHLRRSPADDPAIVRWIAAEDIHVGNLLQMGDFWAVYFSQYAFGPQGRYDEIGRWLAPGGPSHARGRPHDFTRREPVRVVRQRLLLVRSGLRSGAGVGRGHRLRPSGHELIVHGEARAQTGGDPEHLQVAVSDLRIDDGVWIAARATAGPGQVAHTTPIYVTVNGGGFHNPATLASRIATAEGYLRELESELGSPGAGLDHQASRHRAQVERQIAEARARLASLRGLR